MAFAPWSTEDPITFAQRQADRFRRTAEAALFHVQAQQQVDEMPSAPAMPEQAQPYGPQEPPPEYPQFPPEQAPGYNPPAPNFPMPPSQPEAQQPDYTDWRANFAPESPAATQPTPSFPTPPGPYGFVSNAVNQVGQTAGDFLRNAGNTLAQAIPPPAPGAFEQIPESPWTAGAQRLAQLGPQLLQTEQRAIGEGRLSTGQERLGAVTQALTGQNPTSYGQVARERGAPDWLATATDIGMMLNPAEPANYLLGALMSAPGAGRRPGPAQAVQGAGARVPPEVGPAPLAEAVKPAEVPPAKRYFHGTASVFERPEPAKFDPNGLFGPGYYLTDNPEVAGSYATARAKEADYWRGQLAELDKQIAEAQPGQSRMLELRRKSLEQQASEALSREGQPNIRPVNVPEGLNLFDVDTAQSIGTERLDSIIRAAEEKGISRNTIADYVRVGSLSPNLTPGAVYTALSSGAESIGYRNGPKAANDVLTAAGYNGLRYSGGKRTPIRDVAGQPVEHNAVVIFPESLPRITNAISGTPMGALLGPAVAAVPQQEGESDDAYHARLAAAGVLTAAGGLAMARVGKGVKAPKVTPDVSGSERFGLRVAEPDKFYRAVGTGLGKAPKYEAVTGKRVVIPGVEDRGYFANKDTVGNQTEWSIVEPITGTAVARGRTLAVAIDHAANDVPALKDTRIVDAIEGHVKRDWISPRYAKATEIIPESPSPRTPEVPAPATTAAPTLEDIAARQKAGELSGTEFRRLRTYVETGQPPEGMVYNPETRKVEVASRVAPAPAAPAAEAATGKQPWQMTKAEFESDPALQARLAGASRVELTPGESATGTYAGGTAYLHQSAADRPIPLFMMRNWESPDIKGRPVLSSVETAVHEGTHAFFGQDAQRGHEAIRMLREVSPTGNEFEHLIQIGTFYRLDPEALQRQAPELYRVAKWWMGEPVNHHGLVEKALSQGKSVPQAVLNDYPDLAAKYAPAEVTPAAPEAPRPPEAAAAPAEATAVIPLRDQGSWERTRGSVAHSLADRPTDPSLLALRGKAEAILYTSGKGDLQVAEDNITAARHFWPDYGGPEKAPEFRRAIEDAEQTLTQIKANRGMVASPPSAPTVPTTPVAKPLRKGYASLAAFTKARDEWLAAQPTTVPPAVQAQAAAKQRGPRVTQPESAILTPPEATAPAAAARPEAVPPTEAPRPAEATARPTPPQAPPESPGTVPAAAAPAPGRKIGGFLPSAQIEAAIERRAQGPLGKMTREPAPVQAPQQPAAPMTPQAGALSLEPVAAGLKRGVAAVDPWLVATNHIERIPLVVRSLESTGQQTIRQAMAAVEHPYSQIKGVEIKGNRYVKGVTPNAANPGASLAVGDVLEYPGRYDMPAPMRRFISEANGLKDEFLTWAKAEGVDIRERTYGPGGQYWMRVVQEVRDVQKRLATNPGMARHYDTMDAGIAAGVNYLDDPMALLEAELGMLTRKIVSKRAGALVAPLGKTAKELIPQILTDNAVAAAKDLRTLTNGQKTVRAIRDGMSTTYEMNGRQVRRPQIGQLDAAVPGTAAGIQNADALTGTARRADFQNILDNLETARKQASKDFKTAKGKRADAMKALQSAEWAEGPQFGLPPGTIGLGRIDAPFAQGRLFPRETADYLSGQFNRETSGLLRGMNSVSSIGRMFQANFDLGTISIQLLPAMYRPVQWAKGAAMMFTSLATTGPYKAYEASKPVQDFLREMVPHGFTLQGPDYMQALERGTVLERVLPKGATERLRLVFEAPINVAKIEIGKALLPEAQRLGQLDELAGFLNNMTGTQSSLAQGIGANQRLAESAMLFFSPRLTRSTFALINQAMTGGIAGAEARKSLAGVAAAMVMVPLGVQLAQGKTLPQGFFDPTSPHFLSADAFGSRMAYGTMFRRIAVLLGTSLHDAQTDPSVFLSPDRMKNPALRFATTGAAPGTSLLWDVASGRDFMGEPVTSPAAYARRAIGFVTPMSVQDYIPQPGKTPGSLASVGVNLLGFNVRQPTTAMQRDALIEQYAGEKGNTWANLDPVQRWEVQQAHPDVKALVEQQGTDQARRGDIVAQFWQDVDSQREPLFAKVQQLTEAAKANKITGKQYRAEVSDLERQIAELPAALQQTEKYRSVPLTEEQKAAYYKGRAAPVETPATQFLNEYYGLVDKYVNPTTGIVDAAGLGQARDELRQRTDPAVYERTMAYVNRNRDPEYVKALEAYREYNAMPRYLGVTVQDQQKVDEAIRVVTQYRNQMPSQMTPAERTDRATREAMQAHPELRKWIVMLPELARKDRKNPRRPAFWSQHKELERFFGSGLPEQGASVQAKVAA